MPSQSPQSYDTAWFAIQWTARQNFYLVYSKSPWYKFSLLNMIRVSSLLETNHSIIPLQFTQRLTLFRYLDQKAFLPLIECNFALPDCIQKVIQNICRGTQSTFKISGGMLFPPEAFPFLSFLPALLILFLDILPQLILSSSWFSASSGPISGISPFNTCWKFFPPVHLLYFFW